MTKSLYKYTLGFIECVEADSILLLNREKPPHMGRWNGVGGKLEENETPLECIIRETQEETTLDITDYRSRGALRWFRNGEDLGGVYIFTGSISLSEFKKYGTKSTREGILEFKKRSWIEDPNNVGIVDNIKILFDNIMNGNEDNEFIAEYKDLTLINAFKSK